MNRIFKKKNEFSKTIVILDIIIFLLYIIINIIMMWVKETAMPVDINTGVFAFLTGELGLLSFIKRSKLQAETVKDTAHTVKNTAESISADQAQLLLLQQQQLQQNNNSQGAAG
jgi:glucan phosphoethanolaminetransferase (alkaline phosphatase superfamily)